MPALALKLYHCHQAMYIHLSFMKLDVNSLSSNMAPSNGTLLIIYMRIA